jgi:Cu/Ag efflux pump CusA
VAHERNRLVEILTRLYRGVLTRALHRPLFVVGSAAAALIAACCSCRSCGTEFLPELNEGTLW